jgi:hypothetical protein
LVYGANQMQHMCNACRQCFNTLQALQVRQPAALISACFHALLQASSRHLLSMMQVSQPVVAQHSPGQLAAAHQQRQQSAQQQQQQQQLAHLLSTTRMSLLAAL